jgi:hypothetical protein
MALFAIRRFRTRRISETTSYELEASNEAEATDTATRDEDEQWIVDEAETTFIETCVTEIVETPDDG